MSRVFLALLFTLSLKAITLEDKISSLFIIGFNGLMPPSSLLSYIGTHEIGGVILFSKNIKDKEQLKELCNLLQIESKSKLFIGVDEEGGLVQRLSSKNGFFDTPKPVDVAKLDKDRAKEIYAKMANILKDEGINLNFAPSVDLAINPKNQVIYKYGRSFGSNPKRVIEYANIFMKEMQKRAIISCIKHFPGHGSSLNDSHKGFVDVTNLWSKVELEPFFNLEPKMIMSAHIFNKKLDPIYPATLSKKTIDLLRDRGFDGVIISDDMQMRAISKNYDLNSSLRLAINSGIDMLLFGNQLSKPISIDSLVNRVKLLVKSGKISKNRIDEAYKRVVRLKGEI